MAFWQIFQKAADRIEGMEFPDEVKKFLQQLSDMLPDKMVNGLMKQIENLYKKQGKEVATAFLQKLLEKLREVL